MHDKPNHNQMAEEINKPNFEFQFTTTKQIYFAFINKLFSSSGSDIQNNKQKL